MFMTICEEQLREVRALLNRYELLCGPLSYDSAIALLCDSFEWIFDRAEAGEILKLSMEF